MSQLTMQHLADIEAIKKLKAQYFLFLDTRRWAELRSLFTEDADFDSAREGAYQFDGLDNFIKFASAGLTGGISVHQGHMPIIDLLGNGEATGIWAMTDYVETPPGPSSRTFVGYGHYHERYRREGDTWKIASWKLTRLRVDILS